MNAAALDERVGVLVVEDSPDQLDLLRTNFERAGCRVTAVATAEAAISAYTDSVPDLAVIDLVLPGMSGWVLAERIRTDLPGCKIVITSVLHTSAFPDAAAILPKPFTGAQVRSVLSECVTKWSEA
jgi:CheY-like chemotaxis protein